ncbi:MAG: ubiquinone biosynthesis protein [Micavibrio aeruginosavorus]|uniref:Ubiquinone biosynthesis protein n=1 Tax=Micavibrio aeruginosavorus TaxID=349221 RepID=A0A2W5N995_9BACT|nr:MAG: ubiquinone biosynthesis protein [Micavibrio aeruginosavorus]
MARASHRKTLVTDVAIIGGGFAGCTLAALLGANGLDVACIDRDDPKATLHKGFDGRTTAISFGSQRVIGAAGAWDAVKNNACPIKDIKISDNASPTLLEFLVEDVHESAFGWIVENRHLRASLYARLAQIPNVRHIAPKGVLSFTVEPDHTVVHLDDGTEIRARLIVGADGRNSFTREQMGIGTRGWSYRQRGLVCVATHENPHNNVAIEDFRGEGPFAILPMNDDENGRHRSSIVWTEHCAEKDSAVHWDEQSFTVALNERFPAFYGKVAVSGKRFSYPLTLIHAHSYIAPRCALVADAAHGIHPIAGQGLNMGLRDIAALAELLINAKKSGADIGSDELLQNYQRSRRFDNMAMAAATDALNRLFSNDFLPLRALRKIGLLAVQRLAPARRLFMKQAMGSSGHLPALIRNGKFD